MLPRHDDIIIDVKNLRKCFGDRVVVKDIDLQVKRGEVFGFLGPNGSGKTTTIRMLCGLLKADGGEGTCLGYNILTQSDRIKERVGYMTQKFSLYTELSIEENLNFIARVYGVANRQHKVEEALEQLGLKDNRKQLAGELSGGWKQRLALAACLIHDPDLLLLDEPTAGVDPVARREFWDHIHSLSERGVTIFVSTHYMDEAERCTKIAYLAFGNLLITGTVNEVIAKTGLLTWQISGEVTTHLLQYAKRLDGVVQAALFGNQIHVCGYDSLKIERALQEMSRQYAVVFKPIPSTLEDAFISLVNSSPEPVLGQS